MKKQTTPQAITDITLDLLAFNEDDDMFLATGETGTWDAEDGTTVELRQLTAGTYPVARGRKRYSVTVDVDRKLVHITRTK